MDFLLLLYHSLTHSDYFRPADNQKLWLLTELVNVNDWGTFAQAFGTLAHGFDITSHQPLLDAVLSMIDWTLELVYKPLSPSRHFQRRASQQLSGQLLRQQSQSAHSQAAREPIRQIGARDDRRSVRQFERFGEPFVQQLHEMLLVVKHQLGRNPYAFSKVCRIFDAYLNKHRIVVLDEAENSRIRERVLLIVEQFLIPSVSSQLHNQGIVSELWNVLKPMEFQQRYTLYQQWVNTHLFTSPYNLARHS